MIEKDFKNYSELFLPMIKKIIDSNVKFYGFKETIRGALLKKKIEVSLPLVGTIILFM